MAIAPVHSGHQTIESLKDSMKRLLFAAQGNISQAAHHARTIDPRVHAESFETESIK